MATRIAYAPAVGEVLTSTNLAKLAGGWIGYNQVTTDANGGAITSASGIVDITGLSVAPTVGTSRRVKVTVTLQWALSTTPATVICYLREGATVLSRVVLLIPTAETGSVATWVTDLSPTAGAHTYKVSMATSAGSLRQYGDGTAQTISSILVEDAGAAT